MTMMILMMIIVIVMLFTIIAMLSFCEYYAVVGDDIQAILTISTFGPDVMRVDTDDDHTNRTEIDD